VLTCNGDWIEDPSPIVRDGAGAASSAGVLQLAAWLAEGRHQPDVWLGPTDDPAALADDIGRLRLIAVDFPKFSDGRGFSTAWLLRMRYGYANDLRAIGDVLIDQLYYLRRVGFSSFALKPGQDARAAVRALSTFSETYQGSIDQPLPAFRRQIRPFAEIR
jgi:uncharacterized protein (DUF934 family)